MAVCTLLGAKFPSMMSSNGEVSVYGGLAGGCIAGFAIFMMGLFSEPARNIEVTESATRLLPLQAATMAFMATITAFTVYLYTQFSWLLVLIRITTIVGAISVFAGVVMAWKKGKRDV